VRARPTRSSRSCCAMSMPRSRWRSAAVRVAAPAPLFSALLNYRHARRRPKLPRKLSQASAGIEYLVIEERTTIRWCCRVDRSGRKTSR